LLRLRSLTDFLRRGGGFVVRAGTLSVASFASQVMAVSAILIATKLLAMAELGLYMVFLSHAAIIVTVNVLSYPMALPRLEDDALDAFVTGLLALVGAVSVIIFCGYAVCGYPFALALMLYTGGRGAIVVFEMLNLRQKFIRRIACARLMPGALFLSGLLWVYLSGTRNVTALIWVHTTAVAVTAIAYGVVSLRSCRWAPGRWRRAARLMAQERKLALLNTPSDLCTAAAYHLPTVMMEHIFAGGAALAAQYGLVLRFCFGPVTVLGGAVGQVLHAELGEQLRRDGVVDHGYLRRVCLALCGVALVVGVGMATVFPWFVGWFYGDGWSEAQLFARILSPMVAFMLFVNPLTVSFFVLGHLGFFLAAQACYLVTTLVSFGVGSRLSNVFLAVGLFSILSCVRYAVIFVKVSRMVAQQASAAGRENGSNAAQERMSQ